MKNEKKKLPNEGFENLFVSIAARKLTEIPKAQRVENRVKEIKTLAESKTLTKAKQATVQKALDEHIKDLSADLTTLSDVAPSAALSVTADLEETLKANKEVIEKTDTSTDKSAALSTVDGTLKEVSNQEVKIISKEIDAIATEVTAADPTKDTANVDTTTPPPTDTPVVP